MLKHIEKFIQERPDWIIIIRWATATGKTALSVDLARSFPIEVISADSRQIFRKMDIWTDKISPEIRKKIPHHQIDIIDPDQHYTAWQRKDDTEKIIKDIQKRWKIPFIVWWTWLYIDTIYKNFSMPSIWPDYNFREEMYLLEENHPWILREKLNKIDPQEASKLHPKSTRYIIRALEIFHQSWKTKTESFFSQAPTQEILMIWLLRDKDETNRRINARIKEMLKWWLIQEVQWLLDQGYDPSLQSMQGIWYKEVIMYLQWEITLEKCEELLKRNTHYLAKKQRTRFRRYIADSKSPQEKVQHLIINLENT